MSLLTVRFIMLASMVLWTNAATTATRANVTTSTSMPTGCKRNLITNSFMKDGYAGYWSPIKDASLSVVQGMRGSKAIRCSNRKSDMDGLSYNTKDLLDMRCLKPGSTYQFSAFFKLFNRSTERSPSAPASCDPAKNCPRVRLLLQDNDNNIVLKEVLSSYVLPDGGVWNPTSFNHFRQNFTMPNSTAWDGSVKVWKIHISNFPKEYDIAVDNFRLRNKGDN